MGTMTWLAPVFGRHDKNAHTAHHPLPGTRGLDVNVTVITVAYKPLTARLELLVQFIQNHIGQKGRKWTPLRGALPGNTSTPTVPRGI